MTVIDEPNTDLAPPAAPLVSLPAMETNVSLLPVEVMHGVLTEYTNRRMAFRDWLRARMVEGIHFGTPPGVKKSSATQQQYASRPSLYKAGAQLCCDLLKMRPEWAADKDAWAMLGSQPGVFVFACRLINLDSPFFRDRQPGEVLGEGRGVFLVGEKTMGENSALKMAEKRALIDAVINTLAIADLFTQDIEPEPGDAPPQNADAPKVPTRAERKAPPLPPEVMSATARMAETYRNIYGDGDGWKEGLSKFAREVLNTPSGTAIQWTVESANFVNAELTREADRA